jgi:hypothetical protein
MLWALECFFSAVILVITVLGGKEGVRSSYDGQTFPISSQRTGIYSTSQGERERVVTERVGSGDRDRGWVNPLSLPAQRGSLYLYNGRAEKRSRSYEVQPDAELLIVNNTIPISAMFWLGRLSV